MALCDAVRERKMNLIIGLLQTHPVDEHDVIDKWTPLMWACNNDMPDTVRLLLSYGASVHKWSTSGETPLHMASRSSEASSVLLLKEECKVDAITDALMTPLMYAACFGHPHICRLLLESGAKPHLTDIHGYTCTHFACDTGHDEVLRVVLSMYPHQVQMNRVTEFGWNCLIIAVSRSYPLVVEILLNNGADVAFKTPAGVGVWHIAVSRLKGCAKHIDAIFTMLQGRCNFDLADNNGKTPVMYAISRNNMACIKRLVEEEGVNLKAKQHDGKSVLDYAKESSAIISSYVTNAFNAQIQ